MANNVFQVKRTNVSGRTPNTTGSYVTNSQYIAAGEFALNMADGILYTSNGSAVITVGSNLVNQRITNSFTIDSNKALRFQTVNTSAVAYFIQQNDDNFVFYSTNTAYGARPVWAIYANSITSNLQILAPLQLNSGVVANNSLGSAGQVLTTNSTGVYWSTVSGGGGSGTVTSVATGNGMTGGPITTTGTVSILANSGITANSTGTFVTQGTGVVVNATGVHVNATYIGTISANNASFLGGTAAASYQLNSTLSANVATLTSNNSTFAFGKTEGNLNVNSALTANNSTNLGGQAAAYYTNATNITTGTLPYAQIPANIINTTAAFTISGVHTYNANVVIGTAAGISANGGFGTAGQVLHSNGTSVYWAADDNSGGTVTSITMGNGLSSTQSPLTTSGTMSVVAGTGGGLVSNSTGVFVTQGTGTVVNATGVHVNSTYIGTLSANNTTYVNGKTEGNLNVNAAAQLTTARNIGDVSFNGTAAIVPERIIYKDTRATNYNAYTYPGITLHLKTNTTDGLTDGGTYHGTLGLTQWGDSSGGVDHQLGLTDNGNMWIRYSTGATTWSSWAQLVSTVSGTALTANNASYLGGTIAASYVQNTDSRTLSGNLVISGTSFTPSTNTILLGNSTQRWVLSANTGSFSGAVSGITTLAAGNTTLTGWISAQSAIITGGGSYTVGSIYSDANWGMLFRAARASPTQAQYAWKSSDDVTEYVRISPTGNVGIGNTAPDARLAVTGTANISGNFTVGGITTFNANVILGSSGLSANGGFGTAGQVLTTNGTAAYWTAATGGGYYKGGSANVGTLAGGGQNIFRINANTLNFNTTIAAGENAQATGPIAVASGITLTVATGARVSIV